MSFQNQSNKVAGQVENMAFSGQGIYFATGSKGFDEGGGGGGDVSLPLKPESGLIIDGTGLIDLVNSSTENSQISIGNANGDNLTLDSTKLDIKFQPDTVGQSELVLVKDNITLASITSLTPTVKTIDCSLNKDGLLLPNPLADIDLAGFSIRQAFTTYSCKRTLSQGNYAVGNDLINWDIDTCMLDWGLYNDPLIPTQPDAGLGNTVWTPNFGGVNGTPVALNGNPSLTGNVGVNVFFDYDLMFAFSDASDQFETFIPFNNLNPYAVGYSHLKGTISGINSVQTKPIASVATNTSGNIKDGINYSFSGAGQSQLTVNPSGGADILPYRVPEITYSIVDTGSLKLGSGRGAYYMKLPSPTLSTGASTAFTPFNLHMTLQPRGFLNVLPP